MDFTAFNKYMVCDDDIEVNKADDIVLGYEFKCKYPTYRGAYICNVLTLRVFIDGVEVPNIKVGEHSGAVLYKCNGGGESFSLS